MYNRKETQPWGNTEPDNFPIISDQAYPLGGVVEGGRQRCECSQANIK